jgi:hypothetical protein
VFIASLMVFQFVNASLMPLASGQLGQRHQRGSELILSALIVVPQLVAAWVVRADDWGRKPLLLLGFELLPRAALFALAADSWYLVAAQILDGVTAAVIGIMMPLVVADVTRGSGRYNFAQGRGIRTSGC